MERIARDEVVHRKSLHGHAWKGHPVPVVHDDAVADSQEPVARSLVPRVLGSGGKHDGGPGLTKLLDQVGVEVVSGRIGDQYQVGRLRVRIVPPAPGIDVNHHATELQLDSSSHEGGDFDLCAIGGPCHLAVALCAAGADQNGQRKEYTTPGEPAHDLLHP